MIQSRCGLCCDACAYREPNRCPGCTRQPRPFWGDCPLKTCAERRGLAHCGLCPDFPCRTLSRFAYDTEHGEGDGSRLERCRRWVGTTPRLRACLLVVEDLDRAAAFYGELLGLPVVEDAGGNLTLAGGIALQQRRAWQSLLGGAESRFAHNAGELYFEVEDLDGFAAAAAAYGARVFQPVHTFPWGQRGLRLRDPDDHLVEVAESMGTVVRRHREAGLTLAEIARRMGVAPDYVARYLPGEEEA